MEKVTHMIDVIDTNEGKQNVLVDVQNDEFVDDTIVEEKEETQELKVFFIDVDAVELPEIHDDYGRLSDAIEALENVTGLSVIPLQMANIAPEVVSLKRHTIFTFNGVRYAMSQRIREAAVNSFKERVMQALLSGLPFREDLVTSVRYEGNEYLTLALSQEEWTYILSLFRKYKQSLSIQNGNQLVLEVFAQRVN